MAIDILQLNEFYASKQGKQTQAILLASLKAIWQPISDEQLLALGYVLPYLDSFSQDCRRVANFMPAHIGAVADSRTCLVDEEKLPLADASIDRVLLIHALEHSQDISNSLQEIWRVLVANGQLILIVPNLFGFNKIGLDKFNMTKNPFADGRSWSRRQLLEELAEAKFEPLFSSSALHFPLMDNNFGKKIERFGNRFFSAFGGVLVVEAKKTLYQGIKTSKAKSPLFIPSFKPTYS